MRWKRRQQRQKNVSNGSSGGSLAAAQHWRQRQCGSGSVSPARRQRAAAQRQCSPSSSLMKNILCGAVVVGGGGTAFFICPATKFIVDKNSVKYGVHTNIVPRKKYEGTNCRCLWTGPYADYLENLIHTPIPIMCIEQVFLLCIIDSKGCHIWPPFFRSPPFFYIFRVGLCII